MSTTTYNVGRLRFLSLLILLFALVLVGKLYRVQIVSGDNYREKAERQYIAGANYFDRGSIYFSTKDGTLIPAATVENGFNLILNNKLLLVEENDLTDVYNRLNAIAPIDKTEFFNKASKVGDTYEEIAKKLSKKEADAINELDIPGVSVVRQRWRSYPGKEIAAHAVGLIGFGAGGNKLSGQYGLERQYGEVLGREGDDTFVNFFAEIFSNIKKTVTKGVEREGHIITTIEPSVEAFLETELDKVNNKYSSEFTGGIIINPHTGAIYALALSPSFDPNNPQEQESSAIFRNKLVEDRYEMGSIIKPLTIAAGIDTGTITAKTTYNDPGCVTLDRKTFCNYDGKSRGNNVSMQTVLSESLNTGVAWVVQQISNKTFANYMKDFGLGGTTGIDLPNEGSNLISNLDSPRDLEYATASFGQGIALTPITTVRALSSLANGGTLITPHLVREISYDLGPGKSIKYPEPEVRQRVIKLETSEEISRMLVHSVDHVLRFGNLRLENYSVAAKTGTAQIASEGGYYEDQNLHSFFGYFPAYDPEFLIFLYTYDPKGVQYASETLPDAFINMTKFLINYYNLPPDREAPPPIPGEESLTLGL